MHGRSPSATTPGGDGGALSDGEELGMKTGAGHEVRERSRKELVSSGVDDYDPKVEARKAAEAEQTEVCNLRDTASSIRLEVKRAEKELVRVQTQLAQIKMEDDVLEQKRKGEEEIKKSRAGLGSMQRRKDEAEWYEQVLLHMLRRLREEKTGHQFIMETFEESLRVHRNEERMQERHLVQAKQGLKKEEEELKKLMDFQRKEKKELETRLEARMQHVAMHRRQREEREKRAREDRTMRARMDGDLTADEEQRLQSRAERIRDEVVELAKRVRYNTNVADSLESEYNRVRVATGVPSSKDKVVKYEGDPGYMRPDPESICQRFHAMQGEIVEVNDQLDDLNRRAAHLAAVRDRFKRITEPRAREDGSTAEKEGKESTTRSERVSYLTRIEDGRRRLETVRAEHGRLERLRVQLGQTIDGLHQRALSSAVTTESVPIPRDIPEGIADWAIDAITKLAESRAKLTTVREIVEETEAEAEADAHLASARGEYNGRMQINTDGDDEMVFEDDSHIVDATIQSLVIQNECGIRIRPQAPGGSGLTEDEPFLLQDFTNAAHHLAAAHQRMARSMGSSTQTHHHSSSAGRTHNLDSSPRHPPTSTPLPDDRDEQTMKPLRTKEIQRYLAAAVAMSGGQVREEYLRAPEDGEEEEEVGRDKLKHNAEVEIQRHAAENTRRFH